MILSKIGLKNVKLCFYSAMSHNSRAKPAIKRNIFICITNPFLFFESNQEYVEHNVDDMHLIITTCNSQVTLCFVDNWPHQSWQYLQKRKKYFFINCLVTILVEFLHFEVLTLQTG